MDLTTYLAEHERSIVDEAFEALRRWKLEHYEADGPEATRMRLECLYRHVMTGVRIREADDMVRYARMLAGARFGAGYDLREVQTAFNVLEETLWSRLLRDAAKEELPTVLGMVGTVLGIGKDALAREFVALATKNKAVSLDLRALFEGTESYLAVED